jgi:hypothetical protein
MLTICDLYDRWCGKSLIRLLTLLLAFAVAAPMLLAEDRDHDKDHGRFVDPIVGSWIIHVHVTTFTPTPTLHHPSTSTMSRHFGKMASLPVQILVSALVMVSGKGVAHPGHMTQNS